MNRQILIILFLSFFIQACSGHKETTSQQNFPLPSVSYENQEMNHAILNRQPDYGIDGKDGDYILSEFEIQLTELSTINNEIKISGILLDAKSKEKLRNGIINLLGKEKNVIERSHADSKGKFTLTSHYSNNSVLEFNYVGYRTLFVNVSELLKQIRN